MQNEIFNITTLETYIEGFLLGAKFGMEIAEKPDSCFVDICESLSGYFYGGSCAIG